MAAKTKAKASKTKSGATRKARTPRPALTPRTVFYHEFEAAPEDLTVGYLRKLVAGIPKKTPDEHYVEFLENRTTVSGELPGSSATAPDADDDDDDDDDDE